MARIVVDEENNAETWWDALFAAKAANARDMPRIARRLAEARSYTLECTPAEAEEFEAYASKLPGWNDGPEHARHPVLIYKPGHE